ncbi:MAG: hypothetical protein JSS66_12305 [Armatimonadetes bacterium]|nr:hypothetical protein [Armatimonadota bacterium]
MSKKGLDVVVCSPWEATVVQIVQSLHKQGHRVRSALNGRECLKTCLRRCPDLLIVDEVLEDPSAGALIVELRSDARTCNLEIVFLARPEI